MKIQRLTEEEMAKLPFPDTARAIGGIFVQTGDDIPEDTIKKIRDQFRKNIEGSKMYTAIEGEGGFFKGMGRPTVSSKLKNTLKDIKELAPYLVISSFVVLLVIVLLSRIVPTNEQIKPVAEVIINNLGS